MSENYNFFAKQNSIYPKRVWGRYRKIKWIAMVILLGIYYIGPWLRYSRGANAPDQAILIDMVGRRAYFFGIEIWPQEIYYLAGILVLSAIGLFFVSSLLGRVWCGYACPQTVWTDLFVWVERMIQGDRNARIKLDQSPINFEKIWKKGLTHLIWLIIGALTGGAWVFYFNDAPKLWNDIVNLKSSFAVNAWIISLTISTYIMAGYAREQVCTYMCPYARFQSAMFDKDTLIISYDKERGEPRGKHKVGDSWEGKGHCIDCSSCVTVCPTGIDIRNGLQMECIACGLCVDACNNVMEKIGLPKGLIRYDTENNQNARANNHSFKDRLRIIRPRTIYYTTILTLVGSLMLYSLITRSQLDIIVIHDRNPVFVKLSDGEIRNNYTIKISNMTHDYQDYSINVDGVTNAKVKIEGAGNPVAEHLSANPDGVSEYRVMISTPDLTKVRNDITFKLKNNKSGEVATHQSLFITHTGE